MKFEITKQVEVSETIDVELPFYYKDEDCCYDGSIDISYGKIEETKETIINIIKHFNKDYTIVMRVKYYPNIKSIDLTYYLEPVFDSNKEEFEAAKKEAIEFLAKM